MGFDYKIITDASADLEPLLMAQYDIGMLPMTYTIGDEERVCSETQPPELLRRFYQGQRNGDLTHTSQVSPQVYLDTFTALAESNTPAMLVSLSSGLSGSFNSACLIAEQVKEDYPNWTFECVDSLSATAGMDMILEFAAINREQGMSLSENAAWLNANKRRVQHWFMVDDLGYLKRGGRVSAASAAIGSALNIKPVLRIESDGSLSNFAKKRGDKAAMHFLLQMYEENSIKEAGEFIYIVHADNDAGAEFLREGVLKINPTAVIKTVYLSPIIGAHTGPGMCAIVHMSDEAHARV